LKEEAVAKAHVLSGLAQQKQKPDVPVVATVDDEKKARAVILKNLDATRPEDPVSINSLS